MVVPYVVLMPCTCKFSRQRKYDESRTWYPSFPISLTQSVSGLAAAASKDAWHPRLPWRWVGHPLKVSLGSGIIGWSDDHIARCSTMFAGPWHVLYSGGNARYCEMVKLCTTPCFSTLFVQTLGSLGKIYSGRVLILRRKMKSSTLHLEGILLAWTPEGCKYGTSRQWQPHWRPSLGAQLYLTDRKVDARKLDKL